MSRDPSPADHEWRVVESATEYETGWYTGGYDLVELPDGREKRYYWAELPPAVVVVAVVESPSSLGLPPVESDGPAVVMVEQFRPTIRELCYELPAGIVEDGESYAEAGTRELEEEVGIVADEVELLEEFWCSTGVLRHERGIVTAEGFTPGERKLDGSEFLDVRTVPLDDALDVARGGSANDATIEGLLLAEADGYL
ncbi:NUDIX hydrolase [Natronomonas marina]|jgi:ADP-ribose pyrophosphatase|uniref:NUDIX hydrolase n=1 Tax=Natronomonas marina TaxID=2961939 RepID=UPI0020C9D9F3|nr:NUDIX hydrolase [Natronomonas marina]